MSDQARFRVYARLRWVFGGGTLIVGRGRILFEPDWLTRRVCRVNHIVHIDRPVTLIRARLVPPWFSISLLLHDDEASGWVLVWLFDRDRLLASVKAAGFEVEQITTWFSLTGGVAIPSKPRAWSRTSRSRIVPVLLTLAGAAGAVVTTSDSIASLAVIAAGTALLIGSLLRS
jgi:hypothetical protein